MGDFAEAERVYAKLKEENPTNAVRACARECLRVLS